MALCLPLLLYQGASAWVSPPAVVAGRAATIKRHCTAVG